MKYVIVSARFGRSGDAVRNIGRNTSWRVHFGPSDVVGKPRFHGVLPAFASESKPIAANSLQHAQPKKVASQHPVQREVAV